MKGNWQATCHAGQPSASGKHQQCNNHKGKMDDIQVLEDECDVQHDKVDLHVITID